MRKRIFAVLAVLTMVLGLTACGGDYTTVYTEVNTVEGVTLTLQEDTLKASKAMFTLTNASDTDVVYDPVEFHLEKLKKDVWEENIGTRESSWKRDTTETLAAGESKEIEIDWKGLCGAINGGQYRVIIIVNDQPVAAEFEK